MKAPVGPAALAQLLRSSEKELPSSRVKRLLGSGRSAARLAHALLIRGREEGIDSARVARVVQELGELKGVAMKAGQILGYIDPMLDTELRALLSVLHRSSAASPWPRVEQTVVSAFGARAPELLSAMAREPLAVASIGQVHRARLAEGAEVAVKIRHHGIEQALESDFQGAGAGSAFASLFVPGAGASVRAMVEEARTAMLEECDYALEAQRQERFAAILAGRRDVVVPRVIRPWCSNAVLTTEYVPGESLEAFLSRSPSQRERDAVGEALFSFYIGTLYGHGLFHADPHPGNFAIREGQRVVMYDFGCVRSFEPQTVAQLAALTRAVVADDVSAMVRCFRELGGAPASTDESVAALRDLLRGFLSPMLVPGRRRLALRGPMGGSDLMRDKRALMKLGVPAKLLFLFRLRFGLYSVLHQLAAELDWAALEARAASVSARPASAAPSTEQAPGEAAADRVASR